MVGHARSKNITGRQASTVAEALVLYRKGQWYCRSICVASAAHLVWPPASQRYLVACRLVFACTACADLPTCASSLASTCLAQARLASESACLASVFACMASNTICPLAIVVSAVHTCPMETSASACWPSASVGSISICACLAPVRVCLVVYVVSVRSEVPACSSKTSVWPVWRGPTAHRPIKKRAYT